MLALVMKKRSEIIFSYKRYCFRVFTLLGNQQDFFLLLVNSGPKFYFLIRRKTQNEEEKGW